MKYFVIGYKRANRGESGESCNSHFDLSSACPKCGTGAELVGNLRVKGISDVNRDLFETLNGDYLISSRLFKKIRQRLSNLELVQVVNTKNQPLEYYHFTTSLVLSKFSSKSTGFTIEDQCTYCKRNGYFNQAIVGSLEMDIPTFVSPLNLVYNEQDFSRLKFPTIVKSWECVGLSNRKAYDKYVIRYARPFLLVSETFKMALQEERVRGIDFEEVTIQPAAAHNKMYEQ